VRSTMLSSLSLRYNCIHFYHSNSQLNTMPSNFDFQTEPNTKAQLENLKSELDKIRSGDNSTGNYSVLDCANVKHEVDIPALLCEDPPLQLIHSITYRNIFQRDIKWREMLLRKNEPSARCAAYINGLPLSETRRFDFDIADRDKTWNKSGTKEAISQFLKDHAQSARKVTKVIGMGLGTPGVLQLDTLREKEEWIDAEELAYFQHLTLIHIAKTFGNDVQIYVQEPLHNDVSKAVLEQLEERYGCNIEVMDDPDGFLLMDENTFLVTCMFLGDAQEIALEVVGGKGLAGMLGPAVDRDDQRMLETYPIDPKITMWRMESFISSRKFEWGQKCEYLELPMGIEGSGVDGWFQHHNVFNLSVDK
jgi:hypothetical protein